MFPCTYFPKAYFPDTYFPPLCVVVVLETPGGPSGIIVGISDDDDMLEILTMLASCNVFT